MNFVAKEVLEPLGMKDTCFTPDLERDIASWLHSTARNLGRVSCKGGVHDENAFSPGRRVRTRGPFQYGLRPGKICAHGSAAAPWMESLRVWAKRRCHHHGRSDCRRKARPGMAAGQAVLLRRRPYVGPCVRATGFTGTSIWCDPQPAPAAILPHQPGARRARRQRSHTPQGAVRKRRRRLGQKAEVIVREVKMNGTSVKGGPRPVWLLTRETRVPRNGSRGPLPPEKVGQVLMVGFSGKDPEGAAAPIKTLKVGGISSPGIRVLSRNRRLVRGLRIMACLPVTYLSSYLLAGGRSGGPS